MPSRPTPVTGTRWPITTPKPIFTTPGRRNSRVSWIPRTRSTHPPHQPRPRRYHPGHNQHHNNQRTKDLKYRRRPRMFSSRLMRGNGPKRRTRRVLGEVVVLRTEMSTCQPRTDRASRSPIKNGTSIRERLVKTVATSESSPVVTDRRGIPQITTQHSNVSDDTGYEN